MKLEQLQQNFIEFLTVGDDSLSQHVVNQGPVTTHTRLHIYANAYRQRLRETIDNDHPILGMYLGDKLFDQMVSGYINSNPSSSYSLRYFADRLPIFLRDAATFREHPIIAELAEFERKLLTVFDAPDAEPVLISALLEQPQESWPNMTLRLHPSVQVFTCEWNAVETWQAIKSEKSPPHNKRNAQRKWLMWRNKDRLTEFSSLSPVQNTVLHATLSGQGFSQICEFLLDILPAEEVSQLALETIMEWINNGIVTKLS